MTQNGFLAKRRRPAPMVAALAVQGLIIAGLFTLAPKIVPHIPKSFPITDYVEAVEPPPIDVPPPAPKPDMPQSKIDVPPTVVKTATNDFQLPPAPLIPITPGPAVGTGISTPVIVDPPKPDPVLTDALVDPRYARFLQPDYPGAMRRAEIEGKATVRVRIGADGRVKSCELVSADDPAFFEATRKQALERWRFKPATRDGVAVESTKTMTVRFRMETAS